MEEIWENIEGYEGLYQISNRGRVKSLERIDENNHPIKERIMKPSMSLGYLYVGLRKQGKQKRMRIHRLVAAAFIPNPDNKEEVGHKDETRTNNYADNLEWVSKKENNNMPLHKERVRIACLNRREQISRYMSESQKGSGNSAARKVICDNKIYGCILECADYYGIGYSRMKAWLRGQNAMPQEWIDKGLKYIE
jgi:hypothetical protein